MDRDDTPFAGKVIETAAVSSANLVVLQAFYFNRRQGCFPQRGEAEAREAEHWKGGPTSGKPISRMSP